MHVDQQKIGQVWHIILDICNLMLSMAVAPGADIDNSWMNEKGADP